jgi:hypothetical protein
MWERRRVKAAVVAVGRGAARRCARDAARAAYAHVVRLLRGGDDAAEA